jgi:Flp pilus assembly protein TadD
MNARNRSGVVRSLLACAGLALSGCASLPATPQARALPEDFVVIPPAVGLSLRDAGLTGVDDEMRAFLELHVDARENLTKLRQLVGAVVRNDEFLIEYGDDTRSAAETFHARRGNCLSFTSLLVALAREIGLDASYQEVDVPPTWSLQDDSVVVSRHVNARIALRPGVEHVVDFDIAEFRAAYPRRPISDARAAAHFYSNRGVERMAAGAADEAYAYFMRALAMDRTLAQVWVNLGVWHRRAGEPALAEASYLEALRLEPREYVAISNLAQLHEREGNAELARWYQRRAAQYRLRNPYFRYEQAKRAYFVGDFEGAVRQLREALRRADNDPDFYSLLGMTYRQLGRRDAAREAFSRAALLAEDDEMRSTLQRKLDLLGAPSSG